MQFGYLRSYEVFFFFPFRVGMVDYGEFVPEALKTSQDTILKTLGDKMTLYPVFDDDYDKAYEDAIAGTVLNGKGAMTETYSYLMLVIIYASYFGSLERKSPRSFSSA